MFPSNILLSRGCVHAIGLLPYPWEFTSMQHIVKNYKQAGGRSVARPLRCHLGCLHLTWVWLGSRSTCAPDSRFLLMCMLQGSRYGSSGWILATEVKYLDWTRTSPWCYRHLGMEPADQSCLSPAPLSVSQINGINTLTFESSSQMVRHTLSLAQPGSQESGAFPILHVYLGHQHRCRWELAHCPGLWCKKVCLKGHCPVALGRILAIALQQTISRCTFPDPLTWLSFPSLHVLLW